MSDIGNSIGNTGYYQLNKQPGQQGLTNKSSHNVTSLAQTLLAAASGVDNSASRAAYLLDLSPEAQKYMADNAVPQASSRSGNNPQFLLNADQHGKIAQILENYKDAPFTQETFNLIQDELEKVGLSPRQLSMIDRAKSFNPTEILVNALNGGGADKVADNIDGSASEAKAAGYVEQIINQWRSISTAINSQAVAATSGTDEA